MHNNLNPLKTQFPLYALRPYELITEFEGIKVISTHYTDYVLDCEALEGDYFSRRVQMLEMELPFKLYPLNERFTTLAQLTHTKRRLFIDREGKIFRYTPQQFAKVEYYKVLRADRTWNGYYRLMTKLPVTFVTEEPCNFIGVIRNGVGFILYDTSDTRKPSTRKKI